VREPRALTETDGVALCVRETRGDPETERETVEARVPVPSCTLAVAECDSDSDTVGDAVCGGDEDSRNDELAVIDGDALPDRLRALVDVTLSDRLWDELPDSEGVALEKKDSVGRLDAEIPELTDARSVPEDVEEGVDEPKYESEGDALPHFELVASAEPERKDEGEKTFVFETGDEGDAEDDCVDVADWDADGEREESADSVPVALPDLDSVA